MVNIGPKISAVVDNVEVEAIAPRLKVFDLYILFKTTWFDYFQSTLDNLDKTIKSGSKAYPTPFLPQAPTKPLPNETTTPALKARGARCRVLDSGSWVRGVTSFPHLDWAQ